jgi:nitroreductase
MNLSAIEAIETRRAVKNYDPLHVMPEADIERLLSLAILSPTAFNIQHWRFVLVRDPALRQAVRAAAWDQAQVTDASLLVILCADVMAWTKDPARYFKDAPAPVRDALVPMIPQFYQGREEMQRDDAIRSTGIAGQTLMLAAKALGYDSCPMDGFDPLKVAELIRLPEGHLISFMIAIGKATKPAWPRPGQLALQEVVITDRF